MNVNKIKTILAALLLAASGCAVDSGFVQKKQVSELYISVTGVRSGKGNIFLAIYDSPEGFMNQEKMTAGIIRKAREGTTTVAIRGLLAPGKYAVSVFHDENGNSQLDVSKDSGIPLEGIGFSNDPKLEGGPPKFEAAAFPVETEKTTISFRIGYVD